MGKRQRTSPVARRYGIGEWFGKSFVRLTSEEREALAKEAVKSKTDLPCPWRSSSRRTVACNKKGGVCTIRQYERHTETGRVSVTAGPSGDLCTVCPSRFYEDEMVFR